MDPSPGYRYVRLMFGCGISAAGFRGRYDMLDEKTRSRLGRVAQRAWTARVLRHRIRHRVGFESPDEAMAFYASELPSLEVNHLFGCLDTLSQSHHRQFPEWLQDEEVQRVHTLTDITWTIDEIVGVYHSYLDECGVGSNLRRLFGRLPASTKDWLTTNVRITRTNKDASKRELLDGPDAVIHHLRQYFYQKRRNPFTHESEIGFPYVEDDIELGTGWLLQADTYHYRMDGKYWLLSIRAGLDEATILRVIVYSAVLQVLGIEVTESLIAGYVRGLSRQTGLYNLLDEVEENGHRLSWRTTYDVTGSGELYSYLDHYGIPPFSNERAITMLDRYLIETTLEGEAHQWTREYADAADRLNADIAAFNEHWGRVAGQRNELPSDLSAYRQAIGEFLAAEREHPEFAFVAQALDHPGMRLLKRIADDPCYNW